MLQSTGSQRVGHDLATEQKQQGFQKTTLNLKTSEEQEGLLLGQPLALPDVWENALFIIVDHLTQSLYESVCKWLMNQTKNCLI